MPVQSPAEQSRAVHVDSPRHASLTDFAPVIHLMPSTSLPPPSNIFDDDDEGWQDMPVVHEDELRGGLDEEDQKKYHYKISTKGSSGSGSGVAQAANATGNLLDIDDYGNEWRSKLDQNESEYTRLRGTEEDDSDDVHLRTKYLFDEDKAMTPLSQMQATKGLLTEAQRIAYVGLCSLTCREMLRALQLPHRKEFKNAIGSMELWLMKIMARLYYHMELETQEQKMIESLAEHGVQAMDLVPALMTTHTVANPEYDPEEARRSARAAAEAAAESSDPESESESESISDQPILETSPPPPPTSPKVAPEQTSSKPSPAPTYQTTARVLEGTSTSSIPGVSTSLSAADENVTLDIRWTVLCDLFLIIIADSVYDARSRVLLESVAVKLGLGWLDVVKFESRVTEALEIQEDVERMENQDVIEGRQRSGRKKRYVMMGLATIGGGLVIGLSAGLLAPVIGVGIGAALGTIGITGTTGFLAGTAGAAVITTGGVLTGSGIAVRGMARRTQQVSTFELLPLHNNKRVNCVLTVPGFLNGALDDPRLPFSVLDPIVGDVFCALWEPEMIRETGGALKILTGEVLSQIGQTVLQATVMTTLMSALQWPIILTKLGYLIDNPWNNALDRARAAGGVLADVLLQRHLGVRPITLIGFSLGARVIFYALLELAKHKAYGIVQDVILLGATLSVSTKTWLETRTVVSGRYVNGFARNDWVLNYLFRATSGGVGTVAGLRPIGGVPGLENVDVTDKIAGHMSYRTFMPLILDQLGFPVFADYFDDPVEPDFEGDRVVVNEEEEEKGGWFGRKKKSTNQKYVSRPPSAASWATTTNKSASTSPTPSSTSGEGEDDLPPREESDSKPKISSSPSGSIPTTPTTPTAASTAASTAKRQIPKHAGFDFEAIKEVLGKGKGKGDSNSADADELGVPVSESNTSGPMPPILVPPPSNRTVSLPAKSFVGLGVGVGMGAGVGVASGQSTPRAGSPNPSSSLNDLSELSAAYSESSSSSSSSSSPFYAFRNASAEGSGSTLALASASPSAGIPSAGASPSSSPSPSLAFGSSDGSFWADPEPSALGRTTSFGSSSTSLVYNPFASPTPAPASLGGISMSFGGGEGDGDIGDELGRSGSGSGKKVSVIGSAGVSNPWS